MPIVAKCAKKEPPEDRRYIQEVKPIAVSVACRRRRLISRRYASLPDLPTSHAALKPFYGSEMLQDNSGAVQLRVFTQWKNSVVDLGCSTHHLTLPSVLRLMASSECGISDQALKQCICNLMTCKNTSQLYALYSAMKALSASYPRTSPAVNCRVVDRLQRLSDKRRDETENTQVCLVYDYIVSCVELELLHYPVVHRRGQEVSKLLAVDSPLVLSLIQETRNWHSDMKTVLLLQRAITAVGMSDKWLFIDRLVSRLYRLYRDIRSVCGRQRLLASVAKPELRLKLVERIVSERCGGHDIPRLSKQFLTRDFVTAVSSLLPDWLQYSSSSADVSNTADLVEEFLAVIVTYVESYLHIHKSALPLPLKMMYLA